MPQWLKEDLLSFLIKLPTSGWMECRLLLLLLLLLLHEFQNYFKNHIFLIERLVVHESVLMRTATGASREDVGHR